ncbi:GGDEF domain-containing protein [Novosphingobium decolorationis]|uniref:diguanylate cyclase n=1 Tax=Novosphingobium decolorationis TaxID=2698673 RepID=A0ABX8E4G9_9SPHN|nr:GGDEF domain-containing protein [Novosphingobium decolorationis]QVM84077.1 GGDEF domain-containing protein [Novosphingobium decolorationis]
MNAHDPGTSRSPGWARWLGLGPAREDEPPPPPPPTTDTLPGPAESPADKRRRHVLEDITRFLMGHGLPVSPHTLTIAHDVVTGANPALVRLVGEHVASGAPLTVEWLEETVRCDEEESGARQIHALVRKLEGAIAKFGCTATAARSATTSYNETLAEQVDALGGIAPCQEASSAIAALTSVAREMLRRTRDMEREISRSERETEALQRSLEDARREAEIDHLTGLPNRRAFEAVFEDELAQAKDKNEPLCVAFCDIDRFKRVNDTHGHEAGDRVLRTVAQALAELSNDKCHVARHGGEEFVVLLRGSNLATACTILDETRASIAARRLVNRATNTPFGRISFSAGVADVHAYPNRKSALRAADEALFRAKLAGRNRVIAAGHDDWNGFRVIPPDPASGTAA